MCSTFDHSFLNRNVTNSKAWQSFLIPDYQQMLKTLGCIEAKSP